MMPSPTLINAIPPVEGGVWDFAHALVGLLGAEARVMPLTRLDADTLAAARGKIFLLQYSGYGFARRGAPLRLVREISASRRQFGRIGVFFHELYAFGPPWSSAFWLSPLQRYVARRLVEIADFWLTSCEAYGRWLGRFAARKPHAILPTCSNVGEPVVYSQDRRPIIIVFGGAPVREATYRSAGEALFAWARREALEIHDVGPPLRDESTESRLRTAGVIVRGRLDPDEVSRLLLRAMYGLIAYRGDALAKSGVFAAYCAHGACPIVLANQSVTFDGLKSGDHFMPGVPVDRFGAAAATRIGQSAWSWYQAHRLESHGRAVARLMADSAAR